MSRIKSIWALLVVVIAGFATTAFAQVPEKPNPPRLVNDFAGIFTPQQIHVLEDTLVRFSKKTSNQVTIVTVKDLAGKEASQFAYEIGEQWGVGGSKLNNGVVILIKPKNETKGQAFIATGYGVEGVLPDASCSRIINNEMIPEFKKDDYFAGVVKALNVVLPVLAKEYSIEEYENGDGEEDMGFVIVVVAMAFVFVLIALMDKNNKNDNGRNGNSGTFGGRGSGADDVASAILLGSLLGGCCSGRSGGSFGGGSFGGGGFGGFGGGSFGGGGAGGSW